MDKTTKTARVLKLLQSKPAVTNRELNNICFRYGSIIHDLRKEGHVIKTNCLNNKTGLYEYKYFGLDERQQQLDKQQRSKAKKNLLERVRDWF